MMKKAVTTAMVLALGTSLAFAGPGEGKRGKRHGMRGEAHIAKLAEKLNLTDAQIEQLKAQRENFRTSNQHRFEAFRDTKRQLREARAANETARAEQLANALALQKGEMAQLREAQHQAMLSILTAEQRAQLEALKAEREARRGQRGQRGPRAPRQ
jgi:Spy/CpxP family protein refolding chaperone